MVISREDTQGERRNIAPEDNVSPSEKRTVLQSVLSRIGIGGRLLLWILLVSFISSLLSTMLQLYFEYKREVEAIELRLEEIGPSNGSSLSASLWNLDTEQIRRQLGGILLLPDVRMAEVQVVGLKERFRLAREKRPDRHLVVREFTITRSEPGGVRVLGVLHVEASLSGVYVNLRRQASDILMVQGVQIFLLSLALLLIFHRMVTRHLTAFAAYLRRYAPRLAPPKLVLERAPRRYPDELDLVVQSFLETANELHLVNSELTTANTALEKDLAQRQVYEDQLYCRAHYDELTGLANRVLTTDRIHQAIANAQREGLFCAVLLADLDHFKNVNETRGHSVGDHLLKEAAKRLATCVRPGDTLARMGGDEFLILLTRIPQADAAQTVAESMVQAFAEPLAIEGQHYFVTASIGIAIYPTDGADDVELLCNADSALYRAKDLGRNRYQFFTAEINGRIQRRLLLEQRLRGAAARGEFVLHFQPIFSPESNIPVAFEALLRWRQPDGSLEAPLSFIPLAEEVGLIEEIGAWVMETACREGARLSAAYASAPRMCVNVSPRELRAAGFGDWTRRCLDQSGLPPEQLEVEITEGVVMDERHEVAVNLAELAHFGVRLSIDDFGTGYSSLGYLQRYPFDTLKIDRSFVVNIGTDDATERLAEGIVSMAKGLGLGIIAEGVETELQRDFLVVHGCDLLQGYLLGRPAPVEQFLNGAAIRR